MSACECCGGPVVDAYKAHAPSERFGEYVELVFCSRKCAAWAPHRKRVEDATAAKVAAWLRSKVPVMGGGEAWDFAKAIESGEWRKT